MRAEVTGRGLETGMEKGTAMGRRTGRERGRALGTGTETATGMVREQVTARPRLWPLRSRRPPGSRAPPARDPPGPGGWRRQR